MSEARQGMESASVGLVVPVLDEAVALPACLDRLRASPWPVWVVDGGSVDGSVDIARRHPAVDRCLTVAGGRHRQLNAALAGMRCTWLVVLPADARLPAAVLARLAARLQAVSAAAGCLRVRPSDPSRGHRWRVVSSRWRARLSGGAYLDQVPWYHRPTAVRVGGFRDRGPYDSADLGRRLRRFGRLDVVPGPAVVSCREYRRDGWWRTFWRQQGVRWRQWTGGRIRWSGCRPGRGGVGLARALLVLLLVALAACGPPIEEGLQATADWYARRYPELRQVAPAAVAARDAADPLLFDVRSAEEYDVGHLPGARRWLGLEEALAVVEQRSASRVLCYCSVGRRSSRAAAALLAAQPALRVEHLHGGVFAWAIAGLPLVDARGAQVQRVHPYDERWGRLLPAALRAPSGEP